MRPDAVSMGRTAYSLRPATSAAVESLEAVSWPCVRIELDELVRVVLAQNSEHAFDGGNIAYQQYLAVVPEMEVRGIEVPFFGESPHGVHTALNRFEERLS
jgi:hypothetical protein